MSLDRRHFLTNTGLSAAAGAIALAGTTPASAAESHTPFDDWSAVRSEFDLARDYVHLGLFLIASHPRPVRDAIERHRQGMDRNPMLYVEEHAFTIDGEIQKSVASYLGGKPEEIALTDSTTMGLAMIYHGLPLRAGQEILTTAHDHYAHHESIRLAAERAGATVKKIKLFDDFASISEEGIVSRIKSGLTPKTRAVGITWVHSSSGLKLPLRPIAEAIKEANSGRADTDRIFLIVDGVHGLGVEDEDVARTGCDFFAAGCHKWMFGPRGTGIVWGRAEAWRQVRPTIPSFAFAPYMAWMQGNEPQRAATEASWVSPGGFHSFEHRWALGEAFAFHKRLGRKRVAERIHKLNEQCKDGLAAMRHVKLHTPRGSQLSAGLICFDVEGMKPEEVVARLLKRRILATQTPYATSYARLAPCLLNTPEEIETTLREIRALA